MLHGAARISSVLFCLVVGLVVVGVISSVRVNAMLAATTVFVLQTSFQTSFQIRIAYKLGEIASNAKSSKRRVSVSEGYLGQVDSLLRVNDVERVPGQ